MSYSKPNSNIDNLNLNLCLLYLQKFSEISRTRTDCQDAIYCDDGSNARAAAHPV